MSAVRRYQVSQISFARLWKPAYPKCVITEGFSDAGVSLEVKVGQYNNCDYTTTRTDLVHSSMQMQSMTEAELISRAEQLAQQYNNPLILNISKILTAQKSGAISLIDLKVGNFEGKGMFILRLTFSK
jgi:hypothetical protein